MPSPFVNRETKERLEVSTEEGTAAFLAGQIDIAAGDVDLMRPDGIVRTFDAKDASQLLREGYTFASDEDVAEAVSRERATTTGQQVIATAEGIASGVTVGLSDVAIQSGLLGDEVAQNSRNREKFNPELRIGGEVVGAIGPALVSGGGSLLAGGARAGVLGARAAKVGKAAKALSNVTPAGRLLQGSLAAERAIAGGQAGVGLLGRASNVARAAAGGAAAGAIETAAFQATDIANDELARVLLEDPDGLADRVTLGEGLQTLLTGAALGGGANAVFGVIGEAGKATSRKLLGDKTANEALGELLTQQQLKKIGLTTKRGVKKMTRGGTRLDRLDDFAADMTAQGVVPLGRDIVDDAGTVINSGTPDDMLRIATQKADEAADALGAMVRQVDEAAEAATGTLASSQVAKVIASPARLVDDIDGLVGDALSSGSIARASDIDSGPIGAVLKNLRGKKTLSLQERWEMRRAFDADVNWESNATKGKSKRRLEKEARSLIEQDFERVGEELTKELQLGEDFAKRWRRSKGLYGNLRDAETLLTDAVINDAVPRGESLRDMLTKGALAGAGGTVLGGGELGSAAGMMGMLSGTIGRAGRKKATEFLLGVGQKGLQKRVSAAGASKTGKQIIDEAIDDTLARLRGKAGAAGKLGATARGVARAAAAPVVASGFGRNEIAALADPTSDARQNLAAGYAGLKTPAPNVHAAIERKADQAFGALAAGVPPRRDDGFTSMRPDELREDERRKLQRRTDIVFNPASFYASVSDGSFTREDVDTFKAAHPAMYQSLTDGIRAELADLEELPPYAERLQLGILLGQPLDRTTRADFMMPVQQMAEASIGFGIQPPPELQPVTTPGNTKPIDVAGISETRTQQIQDRSD